MPVFTEVLPIPSQPGASFQLPSTEDVKIMAVRVTIDNSGGTDTEPELAMLAPTGAVIATERQSEAIPAGDSGMASWALRLAKKAGGKGTGFSWCMAAVAAAGTVAPGPSGAGYFNLQTNDPAAFSLTTHFFPQVAFDKIGTYWIVGGFEAVSHPGAPIANPWTKELQGGPGNFPGVHYFGPESIGGALGTPTQRWTKTWMQPVIVDAAHVGSSLDWNWGNLTGATLESVFGGVVVIRLAD